MDRENDLDIFEEVEIKEFAETPHLSYVDSSLLNKKRVASSILKRNTNDILLIDKTGFYIDSVFAGLTGEKLEFIFKNSPLEVKKGFLKFICDEEMINGAFEIAKSFDEDMGKEKNNQERIANLIRYIKDNIVVLEK